MLPRSGEQKGRRRRATRFSARCERLLAGPSRKWRADRDSPARPSIAHRSERIITPDEPANQWIAACLMRTTVLLLLSSGFFAVSSPAFFFSISLFLRIDGNAIASGPITLALTSTGTGGRCCCLSAGKKQHTRRSTHSRPLAASVTRRFSHECLRGFGEFGDAGRRHFRDFTQRRVGWPGERVGPPAAGASPRWNEKQLTDGTCGRPGNDFQCAYNENRLGNDERYDGEGLTLARVGVKRAVYPKCIYHVGAVSGRSIATVARFSATCRRGCSL